MQKRDMELVVQANNVYNHLRINMTIRIQAEIGATNSSPRKRGQVIRYRCI